jgi:hypothetical protein
MSAMQRKAGTSGTFAHHNARLAPRATLRPVAGPHEPDVADPIADLFLLLSTTDPATDRPTVELQLVTAHVDHELPIVSSAGLLI